MATEHFSAILNWLPTLTAEELRLLAAKTSAALSLGPVGSPPSNHRGGSTGRESSMVGEPAPVDYFVEGVYRELRRRGLLIANRRLPASVFPHDFTTISQEVREHFGVWIPDLEPRELPALGQLCAKALAAWMEARDVPVSPRAMFHQFHNIPVAVEASYPGYLASGLLRCCWRERRRG